MTAIERYIYSHLHTLRRIIQFSTLAFIFIVPALNKIGFNHIIGTFYSISIGNLDIVDPALMLQTILLAKRIYFPLLLAGIIPLIIALFLGKVFCSWMCPFNVLAEFTDRLRKILKFKSAKLPNKNPKTHHYWIIFGTILFVVAIFGVPIITLISFPGLISGQAADLVFAGTLGGELFLILVIVALEVFFAPRFWCKFACPVGATLSLLRWKHTLKVNFNNQKCVYATTKTLHCNNVCPLNINPLKINIYPYCYNCGECVDACRKYGGSALMFTLQSSGKKEV